MVRQLKGLNHCKLIKRRAKKIWKQTKCQSGLWDQCLKTAITNHRRECEAEIMAKRVHQQLALSSTMFVDRGEWE